MVAAAAAQHHTLMTPMQSEGYISAVAHHRALRNASAAQHEKTP